MVSSSRSWLIWQSLESQVIQSGSKAKEVHMLEKKLILAVIFPLSIDLRWTEKGRSGDLPHLVTTNQFLRAKIYELQFTFFSNYNVIRVDINMRDSKIV